MRIIIVRHGETEGNLSDLLQGQSDGKLSEKGILQAKRIAEALKNEKIDAIISSPLGRANETAKEIAKFHKVKIKLEDDLKERSFGIFHGTNRTSFFAKERAQKEPWNHRPEKGESFSDLYERAKRFLDKIKKEFHNKNILIISHGDIGRMIIGNLEGKSVEESCKIKQANACINIFENNKSIVFNSTEHLGNLKSENKSEI